MRSKDLMKESRRGAARSTAHREGGDKHIEKAERRTSCCCKLIAVFRRSNHCELSVDLVVTQLLQRDTGGLSRQTIP